MTRFILKDPTASIRTRQALNSLATSVIESIVSRVNATATVLTLSLTTGLAEYTVTVDGAGVGDIVIVSPVGSPPSSVASWVGVVSAADTVKVRIVISGGPGGFFPHAFLITVLGV